MGEDEAIPNSFYIAPDILKEIFSKLPLKSLVRFKSLSKEWRSIVESKWFAEMHLSFQKSGKKRRKILAAYNCDCDGPPSLYPKSRFIEGEEIVFLHCNAARPSMTCDGLICVPVPDWIYVLNPLPGQLRRFPSGPNPVESPLKRRRNYVLWKGAWATFFPGEWAMGFGRDKVTGSFKVVRMFFEPNHSEILDVNIGEWRKLSPPPYEVSGGRRSACVNGSIYWLEIWQCCRLLALDLHTEKFHDVPLQEGMRFNLETQVVNLEDRLAIATKSMNRDQEWELGIWSMDLEERWSKTYSISLACLEICSLSTRWFRPVVVSKEKNVVIQDSKNQLFRYYKRTNTLSQIASYACVISPYLVNLGRLENEQVKPKTEVAYIRGTTTCTFKDELALGHVTPSFQSRVNTFLRKDISNWIRRSKMRLLITFLFLPLLCYCFCNGDKLSCASKLLSASYLALFVDLGVILKLVVIYSFTPQARSVIMASTFTSNLIQAAVAGFDSLFSSTEAL